MNASSLAAWAGALVSSIGAGIVLWVRWRDRPQVTWHFGLDAFVSSPSSSVSLTRNGHDPFRVVRLTNVGDGAAYAVAVAGVGGEVEAQLIEIDSSDVRGFTTPPIAGRVAPNDFVLSLVWVIPDSPSAPGEPQRLADDVAIRVSWTEGPVRHRRYRQQDLVLAGDTPGPKAAVRTPRRMEPGLTPTAKR